MDMLEIRTFGGLRITRDGSPVAPFPTRKVEALLVYVACQGRPCARETLADLLWDDRPQAQAQANLRAALSRLNRHLPGAASIGRSTISVAAGSVWLDVAALEAGLAGEQRAPNQTEQALALYAGEFLAGYALRECRGFDDWLLLERERLRNLVLDELVALAQQQLSQQHYPDGLKLARRLVALDPLREEAHRLLMTLLAVTGERAAALAQFEVCRQLLSAELASAPSAETIRLRLQIEQGEIVPSASTAPEMADPSRIRLINSLPQEVRGRYIGQAEKQAEIKAALGAGARFVSIYGRGGVGKTALACKVLTDLQHEPGAAPVRGIVALSAVAAGFGLDRILIDLGRLLPREGSDLLKAVAQDAQTSAAQKISVLLEQMRGSHYVLFLDNLESVQDPSGKLVDSELQTFIEMVVAQSTALSLLITSRERLDLPRTIKTREHPIPLAEGLPLEDACRLLRAFDPTGAAGLRDAPAAELRPLAERTHGFPRALEALAGLLLERPLLRPGDLLNDPDLWAQEVTPAIVQQTILRLDLSATRVLQALALLGSPASRAALEFLLSPFIPPADLTPLLNRLVRAFFVRLDPVTREFALHPIDKAYCYSQIPTEGAGFACQPLHLRAAHYFHHQRQPQAEWSTVEDIAAPLAEFEHLMQAQAYVAAAEVLLLVDRDYLWEWGQRARLQAMHGRLQGHLADPRLARASRRRLAWTHWPNISVAAPMFQENLEDARRRGDRAGEADALDDLGQVGRLQADWTSAKLHEQALAIYRELGDRRGEGDALGGAAAAYFGLGQVERAIEYNQQAIRIHQALNNQPSLAFTLWLLAANLAFIGQFEQAIACHNTAIGIYQEINAPRGIALHLVGRAFINARLGRYELAFNDLKEVGVINDALQDREGQYTAQMGRGIVLVHKGDTAEAAVVLHAVRTSGIGNRITLAFATHFLAHALLVAGRLAEAQALLATTPTALPALPANSMLLMRGILQARLAEPLPAQAIFRQVLADSEPFLRRPGGFQFLYLCGLARAGLALTDGAETWLNEAVTDTTAAVAECAAPGLANLHWQLLEALMACPGGERLGQLRQIFASCSQ